MRIEDPNDPFYGLDVTPVDDTAPVERPGPTTPQITNTPPIGASQAPIQATSFGNYGGGGADPKVAQLVADFIKQNGLQANQSDPSSLNKIAEYLRSQGIQDVSVAKTDQNGHTGGLNIGGNELQLVDGSNNWTALQPWDSGGQQNQFAAGQAPQYEAPQFQSPVGPLGAPEQITAGQVPIPDAPQVQNFTAPQSAAVAASYAPSVSAQALGAPATFGGVTASDVYADPSYKFRLGEGADTRQNSAAARGTLFSTNTLQNLERFGQDYASNEYEKVYGRKFGEFTNGVDNRYRVDATNVGNKLSADTFNSGQQQQVNLSNAASGQQNNQFNTSNQIGTATGNADRSLSAYGMYAPLGVNAGLANIGNTLDASRSNVANRALYQGQDFSNALGAFNANSSAGLGAFNANTSANLGYGNLALGQNQFGLNAQGQNWDQAFKNNQNLWDQWYRTVQLGAGG